LASPPLVVAYALAGSMKIDLTKEPLGEGHDGQPVYLKDIWPSSKDIAQAVEEVRTEMFHKEYGAVFDGDANWQSIQVTGSATYQWQADPPISVIRHSSAP
jgi:aconitate hydratase